MATMTTADFLTLIDSARSEIERGGSMEGSIRWEWGSKPDELVVGCFVRVGNDVGQGGAMVVQEDWPDSDGPRHLPLLGIGATIAEGESPKVMHERQQVGLGAAAQAITHMQGSPGPAEVARQAVQAYLQTLADAERDDRVQARAAAADEADREAKAEALGGEEGTPS